jgi:hypothetical protein
LSRIWANNSANFRFFRRIEPIFSIKQVIIGIWLSENREFGENLTIIPIIPKVTVIPCRYSHVSDFVKKVIFPKNGYTFFPTFATLCLGGGLSDVKSNRFIRLRR